MSIWPFEQEYHCEDSEQNKYQVSRKNTIKDLLDDENDLLVTQREWR